MLRVAPHHGRQHERVIGCFLDFLVALACTLAVKREYNHVGHHARSSVQVAQGGDCDEHGGEYSGKEDVGEGGICDAEPPSRYRLRGRSRRRLQVVLLSCGALSRDEVVTTEWQEGH